MNISRRSLLLAGGSLAAAATLAACGNNNPLSSPTPIGSTSASGSASDVTLQQWYHEYGEAGVKEAVERYAAAYPNATVEVKWTPGDYSSILAAQLLTNDIPDVFEYEQGGSLDMIRAGQLEDLTELIGDQAADFNPAVMKRFTFEDKIYGIPQTIDMQLLYYRPSLLEAAGVEPPTTFEQLVAAANAVKSADIGGFFAGNDGGIGVLGTILIWASGSDQLTEDRSAVAFLNDDFYAALTSYRDFLRSGGVLEAASAEWYDGAAFVNGEAAMQWGGLWSLPDIKKAWGDDVAVLPFPAIGANGRPAVPFGAFGSCVAAKGANVDASKAFAKWLWIDQEEFQVDFSNSYGTHIPAKPSLVAQADKLADGPGKDAAQFVSDHGFANDIMWSGALGDAYSTAVSNVIKDGKDPKTEFAAFEATAKTELAKLQS
ncbi:multiple sugar transport system substrate-binding protein [Tessaracoccus bendigoensis DSM 12906]|uniref:Multiple sugar transport system substrate-binding protein n=1 Tax=Tessaracoccus bendigoensis DSM 12906 TaxID=1123357 RepID=A0A1M6D1V2_9ACTN|nr:extracellular solute-binding protein [Tessaracoccus bendigoensis]SHI67093.1 multiple sugar transport system substrate-binding protein [Tessaracoccus bendigoensis DSM 12906]